MKSELKGDFSQEEQINALWRAMDPIREHLLEELEQRDDVTLEVSIRVRPDNIKLSYGFLVPKAEESADPSERVVCPPVV